MSIGISLGWNCHPANYGVENGIRLTKKEGYKTCPFDEMISNYEGVVQCIQDNFQDFLNSEFLTLYQVPSTSRYCSGDLLLYNTKYKFAFNHESPGHGNLWQMQGWPGGKNHYIDNDFLHFKERYRKRIENFRTYLQSEKKVTFLISLPENKETSSLHSAITEKNPSLDFEIRNIGLQIDETHYEEHMKMVGLTHGEICSSTPS